MGDTYFESDLKEKIQEMQEWQKENCGGHCDDIYQNLKDQAEEDRARKSFHINYGYSEKDKRYSEKDKRLKRDGTFDKNARTDQHSSAPEHVKIPEAQLKKDPTQQIRRARNYKANYQKWK